MINFKKSKKMEKLTGQQEIEECKKIYNQKVSEGFEEWGNFEWNDAKMINAIQSEFYKKWGYYYDCYIQFYDFETEESYIWKY